MRSEKLLIAFQKKNVQIFSKRLDMILIKMDLL